MTRYTLGDHETGARITIRTERGMIHSPGTVELAVTARQLALIVTRLGDHRLYAVLNRGDIQWAAIG